MRYEDLNPIDEGKKQDLKAKAKLYIEGMLHMLKRNDPEIKAELLAEWYDTLVVAPIEKKQLHHELFDTTNPEVAALISLLILEIEVHKIATEIAQELGLSFSSDLKLSRNRIETELEVRDALDSKA